MIMNTGLFLDVKINHYLTAMLFEMGSGLTFADFGFSNGTACIA